MQIIINVNHDANGRGVCSIYKDNELKLVSTDFKFDFDAGGAIEDKFNLDLSGKILRPDNRQQMIEEFGPSYVFFFPKTL